MIRVLRDRLRLLFLTEGHMTWRELVHGKSFEPISEDVATAREQLAELPLALPFEAWPVVTEGAAAAPPKEPSSEPAQRTSRGAVRTDY